MKLKTLTKNLNGSIISEGRGGVIAEKSCLKKFFLFTLMIFLPHFIMAQTGEWTWMKGSSSAGSLGSFGTIGVGAASNTPPALYSPYSWTDVNGNFWLYGGLWYNNNNNNAFAALWKFQPDSNVWTWINGPSTYNHNPVYGTIGVPSPTNQPGSRGFAGPSWVDLNGNLWLYGGAGAFSLYSDLWKYDIVTGEWTCMGNYPLQQNHGLLGVGSASTSPGARSETTAEWIDDDDNLWFYGGLGQNGTAADVWKYDMSSAQWIWIQGDSSQTLMGILPTRGPQGVFGSNYSPGGRLEYCHWKDMNGKFWIYGGGNYTYHDYADLWEFDPLTSQWAWMGGDTTDYFQGNYTSTCDTTSNPRCVSENRAVWVDQTGNVWKMTGMATANHDATNDLCVFNPLLEEWVWVSGTTTLNPNGVYGTQGIPDSANIPAGRFGSVAWADHNGYLWLFGGRNISIQDFNALWRYMPDSTCFAFNTGQVSIPPSFSAADTAVCEKFCVSFFDSSQNNPTAWQWFFPGGTPSSSNLQNPPTICYNNPGLYDVTLITTSANGTDTLTLFNYITVYATPAFPTISQVGYLLTASAATSYQWQLNSMDISGATNQSYPVLQSGLYTVVAGDSNGCVNSSSKNVVITDIAEVNSDGGILISPNPSDGNFTILFPGDFIGTNISIDIVNTLGQTIFSSVRSMIRTEGIKEINLRGVEHGVYFLEIKWEGLFIRKKIILEK